MFEAIVISIHSIEERKQCDSSFDKGIVTIKAVRDAQIALSNIENVATEIIGFIIEDNGMGFNESNLNSFMESDSTYKAEKGGKGVGRFTWLKAFEKASICSTYIDNGECVQRSFEFSANNSEIDDTLVDCRKREKKFSSINLVYRDDILITSNFGEILTTRQNVNS